MKIMVNVSIVLLFACGGDRYYISLANKMFQNYKGKYSIVVSKKHFLLMVISKDSIVKKYKIAYGLNPDKKPKLYANDNRTPEGLYYITEILSMDAPKHMASYKNLAALNKVFFKAKDGHFKFGHPTVDLGDNAYGPRFYRLSYPNDDDKKRYEEAKRNNTLPLVNGYMPGIGGGIAIHGNNDFDSIGHLSSSGCIRMYNKDIVDLEQYIQVGTPVLIVAD